MRISDWISEVGSCDRLSGEEGEGGAQRRVRAGYSPKTKKAAQRRPSMQPGAKTQPFNRFAIAAPRSPGDFTVVTPAFSSAANLPSAVPAPPEAIAPACPMRLPFGALAPAMKPTTG